MLCIRLKNNDPYFCLAAEEYLLRNFEEDIFILWQSYNAVVVGKHQNLLAEINYPFCRERKISLARRISGGGTVFHDSGNVNFAFIKSVANPAEVSFRYFTKPIIEALAKLQIPAEISGRNDLVVSGRKISGNAEHIFKNRVLHHGTLLFNSDLKNLGQAIKVVPGKYRSKAVESNRNAVSNISGYLRKKMTTEEFIRFLLDFQLENSINKEYAFNEYDKTEILKLVEDKFSTREWIYGYSPPYSFKNNVEIGNKQLEVDLEVKKGLIQECLISGSYFPAETLRMISSGLINQEHNFDSVRETLRSFMPGVPENAIYAFF